MLDMILSENGDIGEPNQVIWLLKEVYWNKVEHWNKLKVLRPSYIVHIANEGCLRDWNTSCRWESLLIIFSNENKIITRCSIKRNAGLFLFLIFIQIAYQLIFLLNVLEEEPCFKYIWSLHMLSWIYIFICCI